MQTSMADLLLGLESARLNQVHSRRRTSSVSRNQHSPVGSRCFLAFVSIKDCILLQFWASTFSVRPGAWPLFGRCLWCPQRSRHSWRIRFEINHYKNNTHKLKVTVKNTFPEIWLISSPPIIWTSLVEDVFFLKCICSKIIILKYTVQCSVFYKLIKTLAIESLTW